MKVEKYKQTPNRQRDHSTPMFDTSQHHSKHQVQASTKKLSYLSSSRNQMPLFNKMDGSDDYEIVEIPPPHDTSIFKSKKCSIKSGKKREIQRSEPNIKVCTLNVTLY